MSNGYNTMRWDCTQKGCFNTHRRPKIEVFSDLFPGRISFGDVDAIVEINGNALLLEWKSDRNDLPKGQEIMYKRLTRSSPLSVLVVVGDASTMAVTAMGDFFRGNYTPVRPCSIDDVRAAIASWVACAQANPVRAIYPVDISKAA